MRAILLILCAALVAPTLAGFERGSYPPRQVILTIMVGFCLQTRCRSAPCGPLPPIESLHVGLGPLQAANKPWPACVEVEPSRGGSGRRDTLGVGRRPAPPHRRHSSHACRRKMQFPSGVLAKGMPCAWEADPERVPSLEHVGSLHALVCAGLRGLSVTTGATAPSGACWRRTKRPMCKHVPAPYLPSDPMPADCRGPGQCLRAFNARQPWQLNW